MNNSFTSEVVLTKLYKNDEKLYSNLGMSEKISTYSTNRLIFQLFFIENIDM